MQTPRGLVEAVRDRLVAELDLTELTRADGAPYLELTAVMPPVAGQRMGEARVWTGAATVVSSGMEAAGLGLDTHQVTVFTPEGSAVPHLTVDAAIAPTTDGTFHVGVDLLPRVDLAADLAHLDTVYRPLDAAWQQAHDDERFAPAAGLDPIRLGLRSPWLVATYVDAEGLTAVEPIVTAYVDHWRRLWHEGLPDDLAVPDAAALAARDRAYRAALFHPSTNPLWGLVDRLLGEDTGGALRDVLASGPAR